MYYPAAKAKSREISSGIPMGGPSPAEVIEAGLARLMLDPPDDELDGETLSAIEQAEAQIDRGESLPLDAAFAELRRKHFGR